MTKREKILAAVVGALVLSIGGVWVLSSFSDAFDARYDQLADLDQEKSDKESRVRRGRRATQQIADWEARSLSSDVNIAKTQYKFWLVDAARKAGLEPAEVKWVSQQDFRGLYTELKYSVSGEFEPRKLIQFLHDFQQAGYLHRISSAIINPVPDKKLWDVKLRIDALSLAKAPVEPSTTPPPSEKPLPKSPEQYAQTIIGRNFFSPANNPPRIASMGTQKGNPNRTLSFSVKAADPDKLDKVKYELETKLEGARIDANTGEFRMIPGELGEFSIVVRATDDGIPSKSDTQEIKIAVVEAPVQPRENPFAKDDPARDAKVTGTAGKSDSLQVWVTVPRGLGDQPKTLHLNAGDKIAVGSFTGVVQKVREREAEFRLDDGRTVVVRAGEPLVPSDRESGGL